MLQFKRLNIRNEWEKRNYNEHVEYRLYICFAAALTNLRNSTRSFHKQYKTLICYLQAYNQKKE